MKFKIKYKGELKYDSDSLEYSTKAFHKWFKLVGLDNIHQLRFTENDSVIFEAKQPEATL